MLQYLWTLFEMSLALIERKRNKGRKEIIMIRGKTKLTNLAIKAKSFFFHLKEISQAFALKQIAQLVLFSQTSSLLNQLKVNSPILRVGILAFLLVGIPGLVAMPEECHAQTTQVSLEKVAENAFDTIYKKWRWPVCGLLMIGAAVAYLVAGDRGKGVALGICVGILGWALVPYFISIFKQWTGDTSGASGGTTTVSNTFSFDIG